MYMKACHLPSPLPQVMHLWDSWISTPEDDKCQYNRKDENKMSIGIMHNYALIAKEMKLPRQ